MLHQCFVVQLVLFLDYMNLTKRIAASKPVPAAAVESGGPPKYPDADAYSDATVTSVAVGERGAASAVTFGLAKACISYSSCTVTLGEYIVHAYRRRECRCAASEISKL